MDADLACSENGASKLACILLYLKVWPFPTERRGLKGRKSLIEDEQKTKGRTRNENHEATPYGGGDVRSDGRGCAGARSQSGSSGSGAGSTAGCHSRTGRGAGTDRRDASVSRGASARKAGADPEFRAGGSGAVSSAGSKT
jgi:hypothetical protein